MNIIRKSLLYIGLMLLCQPLTAQIRSVLTNTYGNVAVAVEVGNGGRVVIDTKGNIIDIIDMRGGAEYYSDFSKYESGKIKAIDGVAFAYYSDFNKYEAGKIKSVGNITFQYYSDFNKYEAGKIRSIGNATFQYYSDFNDYEAGKIKSIDGIAFSYYSDFNDYESGKLKSIGNHSYTYHSNFAIPNIEGKLKSGDRRFTIKDITFVMRY